MKRIRLVLVAAILALPVQAQSTEDWLRGKPIPLLTGRSVKLKKDISLAPGQIKHSFSETTHSPPGIVVNCDLEFPKSAKNSSEVIEKINAGWFRIGSAPERETEYGYQYSIFLAPIDEAGSTRNVLPLRLSCRSKEPLSQDLVFNSTDGYLFPRIPGQPGPPDNFGQASNSAGESQLSTILHQGQGLIDSGGPKVGERNI